MELAVQAFATNIEASESIPQLLGHEAGFAKHMYAFHRQRLRVDGFVREPNGGDLINQFVDNGNYMAYGLAASVLCVLGIPHAFPVTHGMTRRGALVFDLADCLKDAMLLPVSFESGVRKHKAQAHRAACLAALDKHKALASLFDIMKKAGDL